MINAIARHFQVGVKYTPWCYTHTVIVAGSRGNLVVTETNGETIIALYGEQDEYVCDGYDLEDTIEKYNRLIK